MTREELAERLKEISKAYEALKEHYEKDTILLRDVENKIHRSEELFRKIFFTSPDPVCISRLSDGSFMMTNEAFRQIMGYSAEEVIGKSSNDINIWKDPERRKHLVFELRKSGKAENFEAVFRKKDGTTVNGLMSASVIDLEGEQHIISITRDITRLKKTEDELEKERNLLRTLIDVIPDRIFTKDVNGRFILCNMALVKRFNKNEVSEVLGKTDFDFLAHELAEQFHNDEKRIVTTGEPLINHEESRGIIDGVQRWNLVTKVPLKDAAGNIIGIVGVGRDITDLKRRKTESDALFEIIQGVTVTSNLDELLKLIHESLKKVVYAENCFVALFDKKTGFFRFPYFIDKYDSAPEASLMEKSCTSYVFRNVKPYLFSPQSFRELAEQGEVEQVGTPSPSWIGVPLQSPSGVIGVLGLQNYEQENVYSEDDVRFLSFIGSQIALAIERKMAEEEIRVKNHLLQAVNAEKDKFFSIIAHDLRGPLGAFMEATRILYEEIQNLSHEEISELSKEMNKEASRVYSLLENLLSWSRLQRGVMKFEPAELNLAETVNSAIAPLTASAAKKNISLKVQIPESAAITADRHMVETVVRNIVSNAIKFTIEGTVFVMAEQTGNNFFKITVKDNGIGIPPDMIDNLFSLTSKVSRPGTAGEPSSGLGLLLCKEFVEKHGGEIWVESEPGKGTEFTFTLPGRII